MRVFFLLLAFIFSPSVFGGKISFDFDKDIPDSSYEHLVKPYTSAQIFNFYAPNTTKGVLGFNLGAGISYNAFPNASIDAAKDYIASSDSPPKELFMPFLKAQKSLPFGLDIGLAYGYMPDVEGHSLGAGLQWAFFNPRFMPFSIALRGGYSTLLNVENLKQDTFNTELVSSLPVIVVEPYGGVGLSYTNAKSNYNDSNSKEIKKDVSWTTLYGILGMRVHSFPFFALSFSAQLSAIPVFSLMASFVL